MLIQLVFVPEGLATVGAFKRTETFPDEKVLQRCILRWERERERDYYQKTPTVFSDIDFPDMRRD